MHSHNSAGADPGLRAERSRRGQTSARPGDATAAAPAIEEYGPTLDDIDCRRPATRVRASRSFAALWLISAAAVFVLGHLMLFSPMESKLPCARPIHLTDHLSYSKNCDSALYVQMAHRPAMLLETENVRQSRPGYILLGALTLAAVEPVLAALDVRSVYGQHDPGYAAYILINYLTLVTAVAVLAWILLGLAVPWSTTAALCGILIVNDLTKAFLWTPHQQMLVLLTPLLTVVAIARILRNGRLPSPRSTALFGVTLGLLALIYANVLITVAVLAVSLVVLIRRQGTTSVLGVLRKLSPRLALLGVFFALPVVAWMATCELVAGSYYSHEVSRYREFVWLVESARAGAMVLGDALTEATRETIAIVVEGVGPLLLLGVLLLPAVFSRRVRIRVGVSERPTLFAAVTTMVCALAFCWGVGYYVSRLAFHMTPSILIIVGWLCVQASQSLAVARVIRTAIPLVAVCWIIVHVMKHGPYS